MFVKNASSCCSGVWEKNRYAPNPTTPRIATTSTPIIIRPIRRRFFGFTVFVFFIASRGSSGVVGDDGIGLGFLIGAAVGVGLLVRCNGGTEGTAPGAVFGVGMGEEPL